MDNVNALGVYLQNRRIGIINRLAGDRHIFAFEQEYVDDPNRPVLSLSFKSQTGGLVTAVRPVSRRLPPFFSNLLPEGHLRDYLAEKAGVKKEREFYLMAVLGEDLPGAVVVTPFARGNREEAHLMKFRLEMVYSQKMSSASHWRECNSSFPPLARPRVDSPFRLMGWADRGSSSCLQRIIRRCLRTNSQCWNSRGPLVFRSLLFVWFHWLRSRTPAGYGAAFRKGAGGRKI